MTNVSFEDPGLLTDLASMTPAEFDALPFGAIAMTQGSIVTAYNRYESDMTGFDAQRMIGKHFFREIAPCTNNAIVAGIFDLAGEVDEIVPYVFTLKGEIIEVRLRLLKDRAAAQQFVLVERV